MLWLVKCLHVDRFAVLSTVSRSFNITLLQLEKRFFKTQISSKQYKFLCETFRLFLGSKRSKKYAYDLLQKEKEAFKISSLYFPVTNYGHIYKAIDLNRRSKSTAFISRSYQKRDKTSRSTQCMLRTAKPCAPRMRKPLLYRDTL